jgi:lipopolysaccharide exporter
VLWKHSRPFLLQKFHFDAAILKAMLHFGKYIFGTNLFASVSRSLDRFITANTLTDTVERNNYVSYYDATGRVNMLIDVPSLAVADVLFPKNVEAAENEGVARVKYYFERMCGIILSIVVPFSLFIFLFPKLIIFLLSGPEYYPAATVLQLTILFCLVRPLSYQYGSTLDAIGKPAINFWSNLLMLLINLGASYYFLSQFGGIGAAYATIVTYTLSFFIMYIVLRRQIGVELKNILRYMMQSYSDIYTFGMKLLRKKNGSGENPAGGIQ